MISIDNPSTSNMKNEPLKARSLGKGVIRIYREYEEDILSNSPQDQIIHPDDETMVCIVAIPTYLTVTDLLGFLGESYVSHITHLRLLKSEKPNRFISLVKFDDVIKAAEFQYKFNGKAFNSMEPETCHVVFVKAVELDISAQLEIDQSSSSDSQIPFLLLDPFTGSLEGNSIAVADSSTSKSGDSLEVLPEAKTLIELPSCPVCLERLDSTVSGLLTIPCQHTFHCECLSKWKDDSCPICRYSNSVSKPRLRRPSRRLLQLNLFRLSRTNSNSRSNSVVTPIPLLSSDTETGDNEHCNQCNIETNLWICLVCGNIGCDRYAAGQHSLKHFVDTGHCFAMELSTSRVWDYAGDNYVHRLIANEADGKLVELPEKMKSDGSEEKQSILSPDKLDQVGFEYSQLLISQLDSQRDYYEKLLEEKQIIGGSSKSNKNNIEGKLEKSSQDQLNSLNEQMLTLKEQLDGIKSSVPSLKQKLAMKEDKVKSLSKELSVANTVNDALGKKIDYLTASNGELKNQILSLKEENASLNEQVTDLMFYLESRDKFKDQPEDVRDGTIVINQPTKSQKKTKQKTK
ncbi:uncharacterized protein KQ657_003230 [Scheffersomyces spartinae]|uniref:Uncharacterized protein n=1 Tax=Scheffersomyces spartinae TaxID=45513 RepID=A0A9P8AK45_9ASCO|nr:uncharacterized protein KQ657_003230 [Scheffersomyces spartinae]KAG7195468.1 hypothetical protein KQ657_003230 [Scheffersomyces spartinae]